MTTPREPYEAQEPHEPVGAYVLHALPPAEEAAFENHLAGCAECRREADAYAAVLAVLAEAPLPATLWPRPEAVRPVVAPPRVRTRVLDQAAHTAQERRASLPGQRVRRRLLSLALAAAVAAAAALGGVAAWQHGQADQARERAARAESAARTAAAQLTEILTASDATVHTAGLPDGASVGIIVAESENKAAFTAQALPALPGGQVYELWYAYGTDDLRPAGLVSGAGGEAIRLMDGWVGDAVAVGISVEPAGGSRQPTTEPLAVVPITASD